MNTATTSASALAPCSMVSPSGNQTKLPGPYVADPQYLSDPLDPGRDPLTNEPLTDKTYVEDMSEPDNTTVGDYAKMFPELEPALEAKAIEVRALDYDKMSAKGMTPEQQAHYDAVRTADIKTLQEKPPSFWDAVDDPQTKARLEALRGPSR